MNRIAEKKRASGMAVCVLLTVLVSISGTVQAATFVVNDTSDPGDGLCDLVNCTLREAIEAANASPGDDAIDFDVTGTITLGGTQLEITDTLTINGPGADMVTVSGDDSSRVFSIDSAEATINDLTISDGFANDGGGIYNTGTLRLNRTIVSGNEAPSSGGGISNYDDGSLTIDSSTISGNSSFQGGGLFVDSGTVTINSSTVHGNVGVNGSAILSGAPATRKASPTAKGTISSSSHVILNNSTVSGHVGFDIISNRQGNLTISNTTIAANGDGGTARVLFHFDGEVDLTNTILANNASADCELLLPAAVNVSHTLIQDGSCGVVDGVDGNLIGIPLLGPLAANGGPTLTHALLDGSPAIDAGSDVLIPLGTTTDQRGSGFVRTLGAAVDMGAFEAQPLSCAASETIEMSCNDGLDNDCDGLIDAADPDCTPVSVTLEAFTTERTQR